jgi:mRNA interferase RelE/StbE
MKIYEVKFTKSAQKEITKLPKQESKRIVRSIYKLANNPRIGNVRPMVGNKNWRLRVGNYRVIYDIREEVLLILIIKVRHRRDVYKH